MIQAVIFDLNGVIVDDIVVHETAFLKVCKEVGVTVERKLLDELYTGRTDKEGFTRVLEYFKVPNVDPQDLVQRKGRYYLKEAPGKFRSYPGAIELVKNLAKNYSLGLASATMRISVDFILKSFAIQQYFQVTVAAEDVINGKPNPEAYLLVAQKLGINPENCLVIEDSTNGVKAAKSAGMKCIAITNTHTAEQLREGDWIVNDFSEISVGLIHTF